MVYLVKRIPKSVTDGNRLTFSWATSTFGHLVMWTYLCGRPRGHLGKLTWAHLGTSGLSDVGTCGHHLGYLMWAPLELSFDHLTGLLNQVRRASPLTNCQRLDYPPALDLAKFLREQFPRVVREAVTLVNNMAQTGPLRGVEEEFTRQP